jgi:serine/threonine protein kinase
VLHQIGVGALGPVFRTYEPTRDRLVAVKVFRLDVTPEQADALAEELGRATEAGLFHPSIVEPVAAGLEGTVAYRAEEYVAAESLDVAMRHYAPAALDKALPFIAQLAAAIDIARAAGVGHGALHPRDIFVTPDEARATGFGVVDALDRLGLRAPVRRPYSAPERIAGQPWGTPADVFSLGAIAFELLTGRRPSGPGEQMGSLGSVNGAVAGPHVEAIRAVLARAMAEDPAARYQTAGAFASALTEAAEATASPAAVNTSPVVETAPPVIVKTPTAADEPAALGSDAVDAVDSEEAESAESAESPGSPASPASLDVFVAESLTTESPREAARKAIAARKRQAKPKPKAVEPPAAVIDEADSPASVKLDADEDKGRTGDVAEPFAPAAVAASAPDDDEDDAESPVQVSAKPEPPVKAGEESARPAASSRPRTAGDREETAGYPVATLADVDLWHLDPITTKGPDVSPLDIEPEMPAVTAALRDAPPAAALDDDDERVDAPLRDTGDRVVTVDEFRARESASPRPEKTWPRPPDRPMPSIAPVSRGVPPPPAAKLLETNDVSLVQIDEPEPEPQRFAMMPIAIGLLLGLLLGYGGGYFVGWRRGAADTTTTALAQNAAAPSTTDSAKPNASLSTPGTSGQSREFSEQPVTPAAGRGTAPAVPPDTAQRAPSTSTAAARTTAPPATTTAPPKPAPTNTAVSKPKPAPPAAAPAARSSGTIVVRSSPSRAAVTVNGRWTGRTPLTLENREFGEYTIRVVEPGYDIAREIFKLSAAAPSKTIDVALERSAGAKPSSATQTQTRPPATEPAPKPGAAATGVLFVDSRPQGAKVIVNGKPVGVTPLRMNDQPAGAYEVRLELAEHQPWTATARVIGGETARVTGSMERIR